MGQGKTTKPSQKAASGGCAKKWFFRFIVAAVLYVTCQFLDSIRVRLLALCVERTR